MLKHWPIIRDQAKLLNLDPELIGAIIEVESSGNEWATRFEPQFLYLKTPGVFAGKLGITESTERTHQKTSWGLMQIMGAVARELGFAEHLTQLCVPETNILYGCRKVAQLMARYNGAVDKVVAAYNAGSAKQTVEGLFINQEYVDKVLGRHTIQ
jgi:soluble lytic murein transglycosylase-like protein